MTHPVYFVSLGPGDPELITLKGLKTLQNADIIYCPGTCKGKADIHSRSAEIVKALDIKIPLSIFPLPMSKDRTLALQSYDNVYEEIVAEQRKGRKVAIVAEGDAGFYSSIQYLYDKLISTPLPAIRIAGVPAFIAAGSVSGIPIVKQEEQLHIIPGITSEEELTTLTNKNNTVVIMKLTLCKHILLNFLHQHPCLHYHYFENIGDENQFYSTDPEVLSNRNIPYFSLLIIKQGEG